MSGTVRVQGYRPSFGTAINGYGQTAEGANYVDGIVAAGDAAASDAGDAAMEGAMADPSTAGEVTVPTGPSSSEPTVPADAGKKYITLAEHLKVLKAARRNLWIAVGVGIATTIGAGVGGFYMGKRSARKQLRGLDELDMGLGESNPAFMGGEMGEGE